MEQIIYFKITTEEFSDLIKKCIREELSLNKPEKENDELLKIEDAVKFLRVSKVTIYKWRAKGILPFHRISSRIYFKKSELMEAIKISAKYKRY